MSELKLLNCPFCGGEAVIQKLSDSTLSFAVCVECRMRTPTLQDGKTAMRVWNTRTPMANIVEKLEEYAKSPICDNHMHGCPYEDNDNVLCENCGAYGAIEIVKQEIGAINNEPTNN